MVSRHGVIRFQQRSAAYRQSSAARAAGPLHRFVRRAVHDKTHAGRSKSLRAISISRSSSARDNPTPTVCTWDKYAASLNSSMPSSRERQMVRAYRSCSAKHSE